MVTQEMNNLLRYNTNWENNTIKTKSTGINYSQYESNEYTIMYS